ncbi:hypothetical protein K6T82_22270 [Flavobacterium sp. 17A]|uniref:Uncharacterized protein n=1 Tax=Flavobacterium potami TaxID=2872310 RepID=A0A9X1HFV1_9FLAO|nr:hypothetical protein [Flavobacterium potami]MBZ4037504.1 hypothetical protein [Flavobacterium potami]
MSKFHLNIQELVQGEFELKKVNLAFVFQVNCPGCFIYGIPLTNNLYNLFQEKVGFIGVATAFEDFEYNNEKSLNLLLHNGEMVGETKKYYHSNYNLSKYPETLNFPVAFDSMTTSEAFINSDKIELMCKNIPNFKAFSETEKQLLIQKVKAHYTQIPLIAETFTLNQLRGTPSFVVFDDNYTVLGHYFGHQNQDVLKSKFEDLLG